MHCIIRSFAAVTMAALATASYAKTPDEASIVALEAQFAEAFNAKDVDAVMKVYVPDKTLLVFDVIPPRQYVGADAYRKDWEEFFGMFAGPAKLELTDLQITAGDGIAFSHCIQHVTGTLKDGNKPLDLLVRVTDGYVKQNGKWLISHEHVSVPVDLANNRPDLLSK